MPCGRIDGASVGVPLALYMLVLGLLAFWFHSLLQPQYVANPGLAAYKPPPGTVMGEAPPVRLLAHHWQAPPHAEIESAAEEAKTTVVAVVESDPQRTIEVKKRKRPKVRGRDNPLNHYAAWYRGHGSSRYSSNYGSMYQGYSGNRPF